MDLQTLINKYSIYKHCIVWNGIPSDESKLYKPLVFRLLLRHRGGWMLRNIYNWDCGKETNFWFIIKDRYCRDDYCKKTKKYLAKANERFNYTLISKELLKEQGYDVYQKAYSHYRINDGFHETEDDFISRIDNMTARHQIWGAVDKETGQLEAYSICRLEDTVCTYESSKANPEFLPKYYVMYGLYDARDRYYLNDKHMKYVVSSARSISEHSNIQTFLVEKLNYRRAYCELKLYYTWWFGLAIKIMYPFRNHIPFAKIKNILKFEQINRERC